MMTWYQFFQAAFVALCFGMVAHYWLPVVTGAIFRPAKYAGPVPITTGEKIGAVILWLVTGIPLTLICLAAGFAVLSELTGHQETFSAVMGYLSKR